MIHRYFFKTALGLFSLIYLPAQASSEEHKGETTLQEETVTVASQLATPIRELSQSVSILDLEDLANQAYIGLGETLATQPSVHYSNNGGMGKVSSINIRGEGGFRTLVLLDGINIADPSAPKAAAQIEHIVMNGISRIEILRGPHGLSYGGDAGGVVDISTQSDDAGLRGSVVTELGSYDTGLLGVNLGFNNQALGFSLLASQVNTEGFNTSVNDGQDESDGYENTTLHGRLGFSLTEALDIFGVYRSVVGETEYDSCYDSDFNQIHACLSDYEQAISKVGMSLNTLGEHKLSYMVNDIDRAYHSEGGDSFYAEGAINKLAYNGTVDLNTDHSLVFGADRQQDELGTNDRSQTGVFVEYLGTTGKDLYFNMGIRNDDNDDFGTHNSYRAGAAKLFALSNNREFKLKTSYGSGFRAPSVYEALNKIIELEEETSSGYDLGLELINSNGTRIEFIYFEQKIENEIAYFYNADSPELSGYTQLNSKSTSEGIELAAEVPLSDTWSYRMNYSYTDSIGLGGEPRGLIPKNSAYLGFLGSVLDERLTLAFHFRAVADTHDISGLKTQEDYEALDINIRYTLLEQLELYLRIENAGNRKYQSVPGYYAAEFSAFSGFKYKF